MKKNKCIQGINANIKGKRLENEVEMELLKYNIPSINFKQWITDATSIAGTNNGLLLKNVPYTTIYGSNGYGEFVLTRDKYKDIRIECRTQHVPGSVDEKLPYLFETALAFEERIVLLVLEGNGYKNGAKEWLKSQAYATRHKDIRVFSFADFQIYASDNFSVAMGAGS